MAGTTRTTTPTAMTTTMTATTSTAMPITVTATTETIDYSASVFSLTSLFDLPSTSSPPSPQQTAPAQSSRSESPEGIVLTVDVKPTPPTGFLGLPREIRDLVYQFTLLETPLWERLHKVACAYCPTDTVTWEPAPFFAFPVSCNCSKREGLGLLVTNRQIHREAAPVFWGGNLFCFSDARLFIDEVGGTLRPEYRPLLRHVSLVSVHRALPDSHKMAIWPVIAECTGLVTLELDINYARGPNHNPGPVLLGLKEEARKAQKKCKKASRPLHPHLESVSLAKFRYFEIVPQRNERKPKRREGNNLICIKIVRQLDYSKLEAADWCRETARDFDTNFLVHVDHELETEILQRIHPRVFPYGRPNCYIPRVCLNDSHRTVNLKLRDGTETAIQVYGTPIGADTRLRNAKKRMFSDSLLRAAGKPTPLEERSNSRIEFARVRRREKHAQDEEDRERRVELSRSKRRERTRIQIEEMEAEARRERLQKLEEKERGMSRAKELRSQERKRVPSKQPLEE